MGAASKKAPHQQATNERKRNATSWRAGQSGNPKGKKLGGKPSEALKALAREFSREAFEIVREIARTGADEGERLRAARLCLEIANVEDAEAADTDANTITVVYRNDYQADAGYGTTSARPAMTTNYAELERKQLLAQRLNTTVEEIERIETEAKERRTK